MSCSVWGVPGRIVGYNMGGRPVCQTFGGNRSVLGKKSRSRSNPKSKKECGRAHMKWISRHKSKSAKGKKIMVRGSCRKKSNKK